MSFHSYFPFWCSFHLYCIMKLFQVRRNLDQARKLVEVLIKVSILMQKFILLLDINFLSYVVYTFESSHTTSKKHIIGRGKRRSESAWRMRLAFSGFKWSLRYNAPCMLYLIYLFSSSSIVIISCCCSFEICFSFKHVYVLTFAIQNIYAGTLHIKHRVWLGVKTLWLKVS